MLTNSGPKAKFSICTIVVFCSGFVGNVVIGDEMEFQPLQEVMGFLLGLSNFEH